MACCCMVDVLGCSPNDLCHMLQPRALPIWQSPACLTGIQFVKFWNPEPSTLIISSKTMYPGKSGSVTPFHREAGPPKPARLHMAPQATQVRSGQASTEVQ